jgi:cytochrome b involved in lipid metabolism
VGKKAVTIAVHIFIHYKSSDKMPPQSTIVQFNHPLPPTTFCGNTTNDGLWCRTSSSRSFGAVLVKKRLCACLLGILVLGTLALGLVAYVHHHQRGTVRVGVSSTTPIPPSELSRHNADDDCWIVIYENVYDVTEYAQHHPNPRFITFHCGLDVTALYESVHDTPMLKIIQRRRVGIYHGDDLNATISEPTIASDVQVDHTQSSTRPKISIDELLSHRTPTDCWMALYGTVYDVTEYAPFHPNPHFVTDYCGLDATALFDGAHNRSVVLVVRERVVGHLVAVAEKSIGGLSSRPAVVNTTAEESFDIVRPSPNPAPDVAFPSPSLPPMSLPISSSSRTAAPTFADVSGKLELLFGLRNSTAP